MADEQQVQLLRSSVVDWNLWRYPQQGRIPFDKASDVSAAGLGPYVGVRPFSPHPDLSGADLRDCNLSGASLDHADLTGADLRRANLRGAVMSRANLTQANLRESSLAGAFLGASNLTDADLTAADLMGTVLLGANLTRATLCNCRVYGLSAWDVVLDETEQSNLIITPFGQPDLSVDNLKLAQFLYLLLNNAEIRDAIDTVGKKVVLILGRFSVERKLVLDALRESLRQRNYVPLMFDFDKPASQTTIETIVTLAHLSRFIIADLSDAKAVIQELQAIVPNNPTLTVQPIIETDFSLPGMYDFIAKFPWVLPIHWYANSDDLLSSLGTTIETIEHACDKHSTADGGLTMP